MHCIHTHHTHAPHSVHVQWIDINLPTQRTYRLTHSCCTLPVSKIHRMSIYLYFGTAKTSILSDRCTHNIHTHIGAYTLSHSMWNGMRREITLVWATTTAAAAAATSSCLTNCIWHHHDVPLATLCTVASHIYMFYIMLFGCLPLPIRWRQIEYIIISLDALAAPSVHNCNTRNRISHAHLARWVTTKRQM